MILFRVRFTNQLVQTARRSRVQPQDGLDVDIVKCPQSVTIPQDRMHIRGIEQARPRIIQWHRVFRLVLSPQDR